MHAKTLVHATTVADVTPPRVHAEGAHDNILNHHSPSHFLCPLCSWLPQSNHESHAPKKKCQCVYLYFPIALYVR
jgi:hypothetical protein